MKKSSLMIATSAIALVAGFAATPASATGFGWDRTSPCCGVDWDFVDHEIDLDIQPDAFDLSGISSICADQLFIGEMNAEAIVKKANVDVDLTNSATAAANMISVGGKTVDEVSSPSDFPAVVEAVQLAYGEFNALAEVSGESYFFWSPQMVVGEDLTNSATAAVNIISMDVSGIGGVEATQKAGALWDGIDLNATAEVSHADVGGDLSNAATAAANIVSVSVTETALDVSHGNGNGGPSFGKTKDNGNGHLVPTSLALIDVDQTAFGNLNATAKVYKVDVTGSLTNAATAAANVISVTNIK